MAAEHTISLKVLVDKENKKIIFAEADKDFVDVLLSFLTLPMGTIVRLVRKLSPVEEIGCMNNIYESVENFEVKALQTEACKTMLLWPRNAAEAQCEKLRLKIDDREPNKYYLCPTFGRHFSPRNVALMSHYKNARCECGNGMNRELNLVNRRFSKNEDGGIFVQEMAKFMVSDDLFVMPMSSLYGLSLLQSAGIKDGSTLEELNLNLGVDEVLHLLKDSLLSRGPLTNLVFPERRSRRKYDSVELEPRTTIHSTNQRETATERKKISVNLIVRKSQQKALYAEVGKDFVDLLFSFLTFPVGCIMELLGLRWDNARGIDFLYLSARYALDEDLYMKSCDRRAMLVSPKLAPDFGYENQSLQQLQQAIHPLYYLYVNEDRRELTTDPDAPIIYGPDACEVFAADPKSDRETTSGGGFVKGPAMFMVTDDLVVSPISPIAGISLLNRLKVPFDDVEERTLSLGEDEVLILLEASFVSKNALTTLFTTIKQKEEAGSAS